MTNHIQDHPHAFLDKDNKVVEVLVFDGHDAALLNQICESLKFSSVVCLCDYGAYGIGSELYNGKMYPPQPYPEWVRDEEKGDWVAPEGWVEPKSVIISE